MTPKSANGISAKHTFAVVLALIIGGLLVWVIQLARQGDPIGYIILTGLGVLISVPVVGAVLYMLIIALGKILQPRPNTHEMKTVYETHRVLEAQNREMARLLTRMQRQPALLANLEQASDLSELRRAVELGPGQVMTPEGFVIDGAAFDALEDE